MSSDRLRFGVVTAFASEDWHSARILAALGRRGEALAVDPADFALRVEDSRVTLRVRQRPVDDFDAFVLVRGLSPQVDPDAQFVIYRALEEGGSLVVNSLQALLDAQDKLRTSVLLRRAGLPTPAAAVAQSPEQVLGMLRWLGDAVLKPLAGSLGEGVERVMPGTAGEQHALRRVVEERAVYLQRYVPNPGRDLRVFVVGGRVTGAVERIAAPGEFRANMARGATARPIQPGASISQLAVRAARALGLDYTGIDLIEGPAGPQIIEVNGNPAFDMIFEATGRDMADEIAGHLARRALEHRARPIPGAEAPAEAAL